MTQAMLGSISILLSGGAILLLISYRLRGRWPVWLSLLVWAAALCFFLLCPPAPLEIMPFAWILGQGWPILIAYNLDALAHGFAVMAGISSLLLLLWMGLGASAKDGRYAPWVLLSLGVFLHLLSSADLLLAYAGWEVLLLLTYFLLVYRREEIPTSGIAEWLLGFQHLAGYPLLAALMLIGQPLGTLLYARMEPGAIPPLALLLLLGTAWVRSAQVPFQGWAMAAAETPGPVSTLLLGGWNLLVGPYLWLRFLSRAVEHTPRELAMIAGSVSLVLGAVLALHQQRGRLIQAGDSVSRIGLLWIALGLDAPLGVAAGLFLMVEFLLSKGLFYLALTDATRLHRSTRRVLFILGMWSAAGLPLSLGFVGRWLLLQGLLYAGRLAYLSLVLLSTPLTLTYLWRGWTLLSHKDSAEVQLPTWAQRSLIGLALSLPLGGLAASWLWRQLFQSAAATIPGMVVVAVAGPLQALQNWLPVWLGLLLLIGLPAGIWSGILRWPLPGLSAGRSEGAEGLLQQAPAALVRESAWMTWIAQLSPMYRLFGSLAERMTGGIQRLVTFLEQRVAYFFLVTLIAAGVILIVLTR